ncbi:Potassium voltage-gated channel subfamily H member 8 [Operophtera brumata]|uniref:Potassium voltage-gated channel subfamily H member 8 n=1 Tax=Operophtera brumata TaxID=104452 RepID=A0A0L7LSE2_OPEBR|nr:Potassium voltage-gated channel subfamily H member 8 [Operophtera brumata]
MAAMNTNEDFDSGAAVRPSAGVVTLALSPFVPAAALLGARFRAESSCLLPDPNGNLDPEAPSPANMGRRRSRAVLYQLSGHYKPDKMKTKLKLNNESSTHGNVHLVKLTRLLRLARLMQKMDRYAQYSALILTLLMLSFTLLAHWLACIWFIIAEKEIEVHRTENWDLALMHAVVFGNVTAIIQRMYSRRSMYQSKWRDLKDFLSLNQVPKELKQRMQDYFQTMWSLNHGIDIHETLKEFPEELRGDVSLHLHREILSLPIFEAASQGCLKLLSLHIRNNFCAPGEYLVHKGDALTYIYYICNGSMEVMQNDMVVAILDATSDTESDQTLLKYKCIYFNKLNMAFTIGKGDLVGCDMNTHLQAYNGTGTSQGNNPDVVVKSSSDVKALTYCDLKSVHMGGLAEVLRLYPEYQQEFIHDIHHDLTYNLREGYEAEAESDGNGHPTLTLPSISEDDENGDEHAPSPKKLPTSNTSSPRHAKFRTDGQQRLSHRELRERIERQRSVATPKVTRSDSLEGLNLEMHNTRSSVERLDTQVSSLHHDVAALSHEVRNAIQALQEMTGPPGWHSAHSNPNLQWNTPHSQQLARSCSHPPDVFCWDQQERPVTPERPKVHRCTQTEPFLHSVTQYILEHPATVMLLLGIDPMANLAPVIAPTVDFYEARGRRQSVLEQIAESENGSQTPSSTGSERYLNQCVNDLVNVASSLRIKRMNG